MYITVARWSHPCTQEKSLKGVAEIGQAFADEVFRVFPATHPDVVLLATNMTEAVDARVRRSRMPR